MSLILDGTNGLSDIDGSAATPAIRGTDANTGIFFPAADTIAFSEGGVEAARINSSGNLQTLGTISVGNATPSTSGAGITFPATQSASSDANTLDDYEEGTWTPVATPSSGSLTSYTSSGTYTKIGRSVVLQGIITITSLGTAGGTFTVTGLPFSLVTSPAQMPACAREGAVTGKLGQIYVNGATDMTIQDNTGATGAAVWTASYSWRFNITCFV